MTIKRKNKAIYSQSTNSAQITGNISEAKKSSQITLPQWQTSLLFFSLTTIMGIYLLYKQFLESNSETSATDVSDVTSQNSFSNENRETSLALLLRTTTDVSIVLAQTLQLSAFLGLALYQRNFLQQPLALSLVMTHEILRYATPAVAQAISTSFSLNNFLMQLKNDEYNRIKTLEKELEPLKKNLNKLWDDYQKHLRETAPKPVPVCQGGLNCAAQNGQNGLKELRRQEKEQKLANEALAKYNQANASVAEKEQTLAIAKNEFESTQKALEELEAWLKTCVRISDYKNTIGEFQYKLEGNKVIYRLDYSALTADKKITSTQTFVNGHITIALPRINNGYTDECHYVLLLERQGNKIVHNLSKDSFTLLPNNMPNAPCARIRSDL